MHTVQHHRLQYSLLLVSHLTWRSPCDRVEAGHQASDENKQKRYKVPQSCNMLDFKGIRCKIMAGNDRGVKNKLQFLATAKASSLNSTNVPLDPLIPDSFLTKAEYPSAVLQSKRGFILELEPVAFYVYNWEEPKLKVTSRTLNLYINRCPEVKNELFKVLRCEQVPCEITGEQPRLK